MVELILITIAVLVGCVLLLWAIGRNEVPFAIGKGAAVFVALKDAPLDAALGDLRWPSSADLSFVGPDDPYWSAFAIVRGDPAAIVQRVAQAGAADAFVARISLVTPPAFALGLLKALVLLGVLSRPEGPISRDVGSLGQDAAFLPNAANIERLLEQAPSYAPAMVNFLEYAKPDGARAYMRYGRVALRTVYRTGGRLLFFARVREILRAADAGPCVGAWDELAAMQYNRPEAILSMEHAPDYRAALHFRDEGLKRTVVIASTPGGGA